MAAHAEAEVEIFRAVYTIPRYIEDANFFLAIYREKKDYKLDKFLTDEALRLYLAILDLLGYALIWLGHNRFSRLNLFKWSKLALCLAHAHFCLQERL